MNYQKSVHILVEGRVQGVGFRYFVKQTAENFHLTGWVRNLQDDKVEILAQGEDHKLRTFISTVRLGSRSALVTNLVVKWIEIDVSFDHFSIAPTA